ncbi:MAG: hypothetical protein ACOZQL_32710 [Myxococcota bacterium]
MDNPAVAVFVLLASVGVLAFQAWRAVLFLFPQSVRVEPETPADATEIPPELGDAWGLLRKLGFQLLGAHSEKIPLRPQRLFVDAVHPTEPVVASLTIGADEQDQLYFETQSERGFVITANYRRPAREEPGVYLSGGLDGASPDRVLKAHLRRVPEIGAPRRVSTLDERVGAVREWYGRAGKAELRQQHAVGLLWTFGALGMVGAAFFKLLGT